MFTMGMVMGLIRIYDPIFRFMVKRRFLECFGVITDEPEGGIKA